MLSDEIVKTVNSPAAEVMAEKISPSSAMTNATLMDNGISFGTLFNLAVGTFCLESLGSGKWSFIGNRI